MVRKDRRVTTRMLAVMVGGSVETVWTIMHDSLRYRKVHAQWFLKMLSEPLKELRMGLSLQHLLLYHEDPSFLERIVAGDENWCHHFEPEAKRDSSQLKHASSPPPQKFKSVPLSSRSIGFPGTVVPVVPALT